MCGSKATIVPVLLALMVLSACLTAFLVLRHKKQLDDWEINYDELEIGEQLGVGARLPSCSCSPSFCIPLPVG
jgi:hypothetical protein